MSRLQCWVALAGSLCCWWRNRTVLSPHDYWRAIVLYGANVATYKIVLALCLMDFAKRGKTQVAMDEPAQAFFHAYRQRLTNGLPQLNNPDRKTVLERAVEASQRGELTQTAAIELLKRQGFSDVVPASTRSTATLFRCAFMRPPPRVWS